MRVLNPYFYALNPDILAYENAWVNYTKHNERNANVINDDIWDSWERCKKQQIDPLSEEPVELIPENDMLNRITKHRRAFAVITPFIQTVYDVVKGPGFVVALCDKEGVILKTLCDDELAKKTKRIKLVPGADMSEENVGTNSIDLAIRLGTPITVTGAEHYREIFHSLTSVSAPLFDYNGELIAVISVWGRHELANPHTLGMMRSSAKAIENELQIQKINKQLMENNNQLKAILESVSDGAVYISDNKITQINEEMMCLLGQKSRKVINEDAEKVIVTDPEIGKLLKKKTDAAANTKITLFSGEKSYNCIVSKRRVYGSDKEEIGQVLIFKQVEGINKLAKTINMYAARYQFEDIIGKSEALKKVINLAKKAAEHDARIVIEGESGTGKEMFAQAIHNAGHRRNKPFVALDCGAIPKELFESTLFGYEPGAFTGAKDEGNTGAFELANTGTLFLDEIGNLPPDMQIKLLRVLQEGTIMRVGGTKPIYTDVRVIAATNFNLKTLVDEGDFREDLYYRLNVVYIKTPPLRERKQDIPLLVNHYLNATGVNYKKIHIDMQAQDILQRYDWPGNIRQLYNAIDRAGIMTTGKTIKVNDLPLEILKSAEQDIFAPEDGGLEQNFKKAFEEELTLREMTKKYVLFSLSKNNHNISKTAKALGVTRTTIYKAIDV